MARHQAVAIALLAILLSNTVDMSHAVGFTFDECTMSPQCASQLLCLSTTRHPGGRLRTCAGDSDCLCLPVPSFTFCSLATDCRIGEDCAESSKTGSFLCVSCARIALTSAETTYARKFPDSAQCNGGIDVPTLPPGNLDGPDSRGRSYDFCSTTVRCGRRLECRQGDGEMCVKSSVPCSCIPKRRAECQASSECRTNEACAKNTLTDEKECVSCTIVQQDITLNMVDNAACGDPLFSGFPDYAPQTNGLAHDKCTSDVVCKAPLKCLQKLVTGTAPCVSGARGDCYCLKEALDGLDGCSKTRDCSVIGEVCARLHKASRRQCVSANYLTLLPKRKFKLYDGRELPKPDVGDGLTGSTCKVDWECSVGRRCTHLEDRFGGCAQRQGCSCQPLFLRSCAGRKKCDSGEICATYAGARSSPFCVSMKAFENGQYRYLKKRKGKYDYPDIREGGALTGDYCQKEGDCDASLTCRHFTESIGLCGGRKACVCKPGKGTEVCKGVLVGRQKTCELFGAQCGSAADCLVGERCAKLIDGIRTSGSCISALEFRKELYVDATRR